MRQHSRSLWVVVGLGCLLVSGCYTENVSGDVTTITFAWWVTIVSIVVSAIAMFGGWAMRENESVERFSWFCMGGGALVLAIFVPATLIDKVTVDSQHFALNTGFWFFPTSHDIKFADIQRMELHSHRGRRSTSYSLHCYKRQVGKGSMVDVPVGDLMKPALAKIVTMAAINQVEFVDKTTD